MTLNNKNSYLNTLKFIFLKAVNELYPNNNCVISNSINHYLYGEIDFKDKDFDENYIYKIKNKMLEIIANELNIKLLSKDREHIISEAKKQNREAVYKLIINSNIKEIFEYELDGYIDFFYEELYNNTKYIKYFDLLKYNDGFILKYPIPNFGVERKFIDKPKMIEVFRKTRIFNKILDVDYIGSLNEKVMYGNIGELVRINEALHNNILASISYKIKENRDIKLITIAGPSSSGKTTFSNKLYLSLRAFEIEPVIISLDNYYIGRANVPRDKDGKMDFETIKALDVEYLNKNIMELLNTGETEIPQYNFISGEREKFTKNLKLKNNGVIIIEGIHGLNEELTYKIKKENKYKIYISCLSQLNIDEHNRVSTTDVRKIRRLVRDGLSRSTSAEETLEMWDRVRRGEEKYIFPYQEDADIMVNSSLVYELGVLKYPAMKELLKIKKDSNFYNEARRLINLLDCFLAIDTRIIPDDSLLKEFIGDSIFYNY